MTNKQNPDKRILECKYSVLEVDCGYNPEQQHCYGFDTTCPGYTPLKNLDEFYQSVIERSRKLKNEIRNME